MKGLPYVIEGGAGTRRSFPITWRRANRWRPARTLAGFVSRLGKWRDSSSAGVAGLEKDEG